MDVNMRVCVLTYQMIHRKTFDTLFRLKACGYTNVCVYAKPMHYSKKYIPLVEHRPSIETYDWINEIGYEKLVRNLDYEIFNISDYKEITEDLGTVFLVCGAGIVSDEMIHKYYIINAHPGYIPMVRGLDALKWAVLGRLPIGVTTHILGDYVDAGQVIERRRVPIYAYDTFHSVAYRQYELEVQMLVDAIDKVDHVAFFTDGESYSVHRRMPHDLESKLYEAFIQYKEQILKEKQEWNLEI